MNISISDLLKKENISLIDLRSIEKFNDNHLKGAKNIPKALLIKDPNKYLEKNKFYYLYCQNGEYSYRICSFLNKKGFKTINVLGGYEAWILNKNVF